MTMDWRAQSRSRSRLRAPVAPPTLSMPEVTTTPVTANLSRFYGDAGSSTNDTVHQDFAASLGLSSHADMFGSSSGFDPNSLDFTQLRGAPTTQSPTSYGASPPSFSGAASPSAFAFPDAASPPGSTTASTDANLAAIESTLNQLISLQSIATSSPHPNSWMSSPSPIASGSPAKTSAALPTFAPHSFSDLLPKQEEDGSYSFGQADRYNGEGSTPQPSTSAQLQLQHLANQVRACVPAFVDSGSDACAPYFKVRKAGQASQLPTSRSSASPYINATTLAQSSPSRPFSFAPQSLVSGLSLARPTHVLPESFHALSPAELYSAPPTPSHVYPSSAPTHPNFLNPPSPYFEGHDSQPLYDYFQSPDSYPSPYHGNPHDLAPTHINPSHLLSLQGSGIYDSDSSWGGFSPAAAFSPASGNESGRSTPSPHDEPSPAQTQLRKSHHSQRASSLASHALHSASSPDLVSLGSSSKSAPGSRTHSRSNTVSLPQSIYEGTPLASSAVKDSNAPQPIGAGAADDSAIKCLNCSTTVRFFVLPALLSQELTRFSPLRTPHSGVAMPRVDRFATRAASSATCMVWTAPQT